MKNSIRSTLVVSMLAALIPSVVAQTKLPHPNQSELSGETLNPRAVNLVQPEHRARARGLHGTVQVRVNVDKKGDVTAALAISGPAIFYEAAEQAARKSKFAPGPRGLRLSYTFEDHVQEKCSDREVQLFNRQERHAENVWDLLTFSKGTQSLSLVAKLSIQFLDTGEIGQVEVVAESSTGHERTLIALADRIAFVPACSNGQRVTVTQMVDFDEYGFRLRMH